MAHPVILPRQGQSVESCIITQWHKKKGDQVQEGELLFSYETDKASFEEMAKASGTLLAVFYEADDDVPVLTTVGVIGEEGEDYSALLEGGAPEAAEEKAAPVAAEAEQAAPEEKAEAPAASAPAAALSGVSPRARMTANRLGVDLLAASPTGPHGRVIERDVFAARELGAVAPLAQETPAAATVAGAAVAASQAEYEDIKLSNVRRVIAKTMHESISQMAQLTHHSSFDATRMLALRARFKAAPEELGLNAITINDLILFAVSRTLLRHPDLNAHFLGDKIRKFRQVNLGVAVDTPRGLLVPTVFAADQKSLLGLSKAAKEVITPALAGSISPDLLTGGSFTVSNLGQLGIEMFTPIINPPQVAILGVDCAVERVRTVNGQITTYPAMGLSLTYDHRAVDGAPASRFLKDLAQALENIDTLIAD